MHINKNILFKVFIYWVVFSLYLFFTFGDKMIGFLAMDLPMIFHSYVLVASYKKRFVIIFEKIIVFMSFIASLFWVCNILFTGFIETFIKTFQFSEAYGIAFGDLNSNVTANIIFYTLPNYTSIDQDDGVFSYILRNSGFAWEPGAFASIIIMAMFCNAIINKFKFNRSLYILVIGLLSSQSTTGLLLFSIFLLFYAYNQSRAKFIRLSIFFVVIIGIILTSSIVENKFIAESDTESINSLRNSDVYSPRRWLSFQIDFMDFLDHPFGSGLGKYTWHYSFAKNVNTISGLGKVLANYGIIGASAFFYFLTKSSKIFSELFNYKGKYMLLIFIVGILFSYGFQLDPVFAYFWTYTLFLNNYENRNARLNPKRISL
jgi:hypothetical protein